MTPRQSRAKVLHFMQEAAYERLHPHEFRMEMVTAPVIAAKPLTRVWRVGKRGIFYINKKGKKVYA